MSVTAERRKQAHPISNREHLSRSSRFFQRWRLGWLAPFTLILTLFWSPLQAQAQEGTASGPSYF
ncbi:MAG: hypothetical protein AAF203_06415, partial [Pseudomonadota bacterium]